MWAVIGGTGFENFEGFKTIEKLNAETPFGLASQGFKKVNVDGTEFLFIPRHGEHHDKTPSEVNYRANIFALKNNGATKLLAFSAIGSLDKNLAPGDMVIPTQFIDKTKGIRKSSFTGEGVVAHVSLAKPVSKELVDFVLNLKPNLNFKIHSATKHVTIEGPYFSTQAESQDFIASGFQTIGMTSFPEYALAREAGLAYLPCAFVTDYDAWDDSIPHVTVSEVMQVMKENNKSAFEVLKLILKTKDKKILDLSAKELSLSSGLMTPKELLPDWFKTLLS